MKGHIVTRTLMILLTVTILPAVVFGQDTPGMTGAGAAALPAGTLFTGIPVSVMQFGMGTFINGDGSASGQVTVTLVGTTLLGLPTEIALEGEVTSGTINPDGSATVSGTGSLDLGNGLPPITDVPFVITATTSTVGAVINGLPLPSVPLNAGIVIIE